MAKSVWLLLGLLRTCMLTTTPIFEIGNNVLDACDTVGSVMDTTHNNDTNAAILIGGHTRSRKLVTEKPIRGCLQKQAAFTALLADRLSTNFLTPYTSPVVYRYFVDYIFQNNKVMYFSDVLVAKTRGNLAGKESIE